MASDLRGFLRDWIHETPLSLCGVGADTCPDWDLANALAKAIEERDSDLGNLAREELMTVTQWVIKQHG